MIDKDMVWNFKWGRGVGFQIMIYLLVCCYMILLKKKEGFIMDCITVFVLILYNNYLFINFMIDCVLLCIWGKLSEFVLLN